MFFFYFREIFKGTLIIEHLRMTASDAFSSNSKQTAGLLLRKWNPSS